jgi:hypothetical protein
VTKQKGAPVAWIRATVSQVFKEKARPYALAYIQTEGPSKGKDVTFSLGCWQGQVAPQNGQVVELKDIQLFAGGWRAEEARPVTL